MEPLKDNLIKGENYKELIKKYNLAIKHGFYLEGTTIVYSLIEDRLSEALQILGLVYVDKKGRLCWIRVLSGLKGRYFLCSFKKEDRLPNSTSIAAKLDLLKACIDFAKGDEPAFENGLDSKSKELVSFVYRACRKIELEEGFFGEAEQWRRGRNSLIHALVNFRSPLEIEEEAKRASLDGFEIFRTLDRHVCRKVKKEVAIKNKG